MARYDDEELNELVNGQDTTEELSATTTETQDFASIQAAEWLDRVVYHAEPRRRFLELSREFDDLVGTGAKELTIPRTTSTVDMSGDNKKAEGASRNYTELQALDGETVTIQDDSDVSDQANSDWYEGALRISKQQVMTTPVNVMEVARRKLAEQIARDVDLELYNEAVDAAANVVATEGDLTGSTFDDEHGVTEHSSGSHVVDQTESGRLTPDSIAEAQARIEANNWEPFALMISSDQKKDLRTDSQFTNAAEYGSDDVVLNGEIGMYLGLRIVVSNTVDEAAVMIGRERESGADVAQAIVWKEQPEVNHTFKYEENEHRFYYDQAFKVATVQPTALAVIDTGANVTA